MKKAGMILFKLVAGVFMLPQIIGSISLMHQHSGATYEEYQQLNNILVPVFLIFLLFMIFDVFKKFSERHTDLFILYGVIYLGGIIFLLKNISAAI